VQVLEAVTAGAGTPCISPRAGGRLLDGCARRGATDAVMAKALASDAVLLARSAAPNGITRWPAWRPEQGILGLRKGAGGVYTNIRPVKAYPALADVFAAEGDRLVGVDMVCCAS